MASKDFPLIVTFDYGEGKTSAWVLTPEGAHKIHHTLESLFDKRCERITIPIKPSRVYLADLHHQRFDSQGLEWSTRLAAEAV